MSDLNDAILRHGNAMGDCIWASPSPFHAGTVDIGQVIDVLRHVFEQG